MGTPFLNKIIIFAILLTLGNPVQAFIIDRGNYLTDTKSGLDWLDVTESVNRSYNDVIMQFGPGGDFEGWRYATDVEFNDLVSNYTGESINSFLSVNQELNKIDGLVILLGSNLDSHWIHFYGETYDSSIGLNEGDGEDASSGILSPTANGDLWVGVILDCDTLYCPNDLSMAHETKISPDLHVYGIGSFLVRDSISIPEPRPLFLLMGFALYLILRRFYVLPNTINNRRVRYTSSRDHGHSVKRL